MNRFFWLCLAQACTHNIKGANTKSLNIKGSLSQSETHALLKSKDPIV